MTREKQIEEMARIICNLCTKDGCLCDGGYCNYNCHAYEVATRLYNAGYRKASDVAEEIFAELKKVMIDEYRYPIIAELKKKYTEGVGNERLHIKTL